MTPLFFRYVFVLVALTSCLTTGTVAEQRDESPPAPLPAGPLTPGTTFQDCPQCPEMVVVPPGTFLMGDGDRESARLLPQHEVRIARPFAVGRFEITTAQWDACVTDDRCRRIFHYFESINLGAGPVAKVTWHDAKTYVAWLSRITGKSYRLLSEAEWEYAARAGTATRWFCGDDPSCLESVAWYRGNSGKRTHPVGGKRANAFGLHDVHGSLWEWVQDCWHPDYRGAPSDGSARTTDGTGQVCSDFADHVLRGGAWSSTAWTLRIANRFGESASTSIFGIRVARDLHLPETGRR